MLKQVLIIIALTISASLFSQHIKLNTDTQIDTLRLWVNYSEDVSTEMKQELDNSFTTEIANFNKQSNSFYIAIDSTNKKNLIILDFDRIKYVNTARNISATSLDLLILAGHIALISTYGWTLPLWPFCMPSAGSYIDMYYDEAAFSDRSQETLWVHFNGFFMKKEKQQRKIVKKYAKTVKKMLYRIDDQNKENKGIY